MEQRLRHQSGGLEAREEAIPVQTAATTATGDQNEADHYADAEEGESATSVPTAPDASALSDPPAGFPSALSIDAAVQTPQRPPKVHLPIIRSSDEQMVNVSDIDRYNVENTPIDVTRLEEPFLQVLIDYFYQSIYPIFPIISHRRFRQQYHLWSLSGRDNGPSAPDHEFQLLLYAILAVASSIIPDTHEVFDQPDFEAYKWVDLADLLYQHAILLSAGRSYEQSPLAGINTIAAQGLLSLYLIERGKVNDAWVTAGHAIRLYQSFDLEDSIDAASEVKDLRLAHTNLWWCLYILDRSLSTALLKPLAIDDAESDLESCDGEDYIASSTAGKVDCWFSVIADFHITMGRIYRSVRLIRKAESSRNTMLKDTLRSYVKKHDAELEKYYTRQVLPKIETSNSQEGPLALQTIAVSSYYIGLVLLYRTFIERFNIAEPEVLLRCAEAASNCIKVTPQVVAHVPASHFVIQQSRAIFASAKVLLHCMRLARNPSFTNKAWPDVESGLDMLREVKIQWPEIKKYQILTEEDMHLTQAELSKHDLFYKTFDCFGQMAETRRTLTGETRASRVYHQLSDASLDLRDINNLPLEPSNGSPKSLLSSNYSQKSNSLKHSQPNDHSQHRSKRRKLSLPTSQLQPPSNDLSALEMLPILRDSTDCPIMDHMIMTGDMLLPDITPGQDNLEDLSTSFFGDAMLMGSIDQFFSQSEA